MAVRKVVQKVQKVKKVKKVRQNVTRGASQKAAKRVQWEGPTVLVMAAARGASQKAAKRVQ